MWEVFSQTGLPADGSWVVDKEANKIWLTGLKATFDIDSTGKLHLSETQVETFLQAQAHDDDFEKSLRYESDFFGPKPATDVILNGSAWAHGERPAETVDVSLQVGPIRKRLRVHGDRYWRPGVVDDLVASSPKPFLQIPIVYERAYGGWDRTSENEPDHRLELRNPVGCGFVTNPRGAAGLPFPNVEDPANPLRSWRDRPAPAGLGAVACHWSPRRELAGTYDDAWMKTRRPLWPVDLDPRYHCSAPPDQQVDGYLKGGEPVHLQNLSPHGEIRFNLPKLSFGFSTRIGSQTVHKRGNLATVILEPDYPRVIMVWQSALVCNRDADYLEETTIRLKRRI